MGCRELDIREYYRFTGEAEKPLSGQKNTPPEKVVYADFYTVISNYRYYSPELGRWTKRDPIMEDGGYNLYAMVGNNPNSHFDYLGNGPIDYILTGKWNASEAEVKAGATGWAEGLGKIPFTDKSLGKWAYTGDADADSDILSEAIQNQKSANYINCFKCCMINVNKKGLAIAAAAVGASPATPIPKVILPHAITRGAVGMGPGASSFTSAARAASIATKSKTLSGLAAQVKAAPVKTAVKGAIAAVAIAETAAAAYCAKKCSECE